MRGSQLLAILLALLLPWPVAADPPAVATYDLDVEFIPDQHFLSARVTIRFDDVPDPSDTLTFFLHGELQVDSLAIGNRMAPVRQSPASYYYDYSLSARRVELEVSDHSLEEGLTVWYSGTMHASAARSPSDYMRIDSDGVFLRSYGYSLWFPVFLEQSRDSYAVSFPRARIRTPADFVSVFVGEHVATHVEAGTRITEWRADNVDLADAQCTARPFVTRTDCSFHVYYIDEPGSQETAQQVLAFTKEVTRFYRAHYRKTAAAGEIHIMEMPEYGNISSGNVVGISSDTWDNFEKETDPQITLAHELVHPFVQPPVGMADPIYALVIEGFPSYFHLLALRELLGEAFFSDFLSSREASYLRKRETGRDRRSRPLPPEKPIYEITPDEIGTYKDRFVLCDRVLLFLDFLRVRMGTEKFFQFTSELFQLDSLDRAAFRTTVLKYLPESGDDLHLWLETTMFPENLQRQRS
jgi:hypothetical protein